MNLHDIVHKIAHLVLHGKTLASDKKIGPSANSKHVRDVKIVIWYRISATNTTFSTIVMHLIFVVALDFRIYALKL